MPEIHDFGEGMRRAEEALARSTMSEANKGFIRRFIAQKTANQVKKPRLIKYLITLRLIAEQYLGGQSFVDLSKDDLVANVTAIARSGRSTRTK